MATGQEGLRCRRMGEFEAWAIFVLASSVGRGGHGHVIRDACQRWRQQQKRSENLESLQFETVSTCLPLQMTCGGGAARHFSTSMFHAAQRQVAGLPRVPSAAVQMGNTSDRSAAFDGVLVDMVLTNIRNILDGI